MQFGHNEVSRDNELYLRYNDILYAALAMNPNVWSNYVVTKSSDTVTFYVNGISSVNRITIVPTINATTNNVGGFESTTNTLRGKIAQALYYERALTEAEISQNFNATRGRYGI